jgi:hypothetical protein
MRSAPWVTILQTPSVERLSSAIEQALSRQDAGTLSAARAHACLYDRRAQIARLSEWLAQTTCPAPAETQSVPPALSCDGL